jgi:glycyl-tRNA synthetase
MVAATSEAPPADLVDKIISLSKRRGFVYPSSEIYGGLSSSWDYGPLGVELKNNIKAAWWRAMTQLRDDVVGLDASILMHPTVWHASGHVENFTDPLVDCRNCKQRFRLDQIPGAEALEPGEPAPEGFVASLACPNCGEHQLTSPRQFNLMFKTFMGPVEEDAATVFLRPETCQGIYVNFENVRVTTRRKLPFGVAQIGKAFRNEITPGNFIFRTREFEQMEQQFFCAPAEAEQWFQHWRKVRMEYYLSYGVTADRLRYRQHGKHELAHYAAAAEDIEYLFPFGWKEFEGVHNRTDYDLRRHSQFSGKDLSYFDETTRERYTPYIIETSAGCDRSLFVFLLDAYHEEPDKDETRVVMRFHPLLAPYKAAVLPLSKKPELAALSRTVHGQLRRFFPTDYDETQSIGRRYRRQDEIGTPWCVTVDFESLNDHAVTIRDRDTMLQERVPIPEVAGLLRSRLDALL